MDHVEMLHYLHQQGHFHKVGDDGFVDEKRAWADVSKLPQEHDDVRAAVASWQSYRSLKVDGHFGDVSAMVRVQEDGFRCGYPDVMERRSAASQWGKNCRSVTTAFDLDGIRRTKDFSVREAWSWGHPLLNGTCGIKVSLIDSMSIAMVYAALARMGRGTLAYAYLPTGGCGYRLSQSYNQSVTWSAELLREVAMHELGHSLGLPHGGIALMRPYATGRLDESNVIDDWVRKQLLSRYGPPTDVPSPPPPPSPPPLPPPPSPTGVFDHGIVEAFDAEGNLLDDKWEMTRRAKAPGQ